MTPEGKVKAAGRNIVRDLNIYQFPVQQGGTSRAGIPDDCLCVAGLFVTIEYKAHMDWRSRTATAYKTLPTMRQCLEMSTIARNGGVPLVVDKVGLPLLKEILRALLVASKRADYIKTCPLVWRWTLNDYISYTNGEGDLLWNNPFVPIYKGL